MKLKYFLFILFSGLMVACKTPKDVIYFQGIDDLSEAQLDSLSQEYVTKITNDDLLSISVASWDPAAVTPFNPPVLHIHRKEISHYFLHKVYIHI